jgi:hypothetical protein
MPADTPRPALIVRSAARPGRTGRGLTDGPPPTA